MGLGIVTLRSMMRMVFQPYLGHATGPSRKVEPIAMNSDDGSLLEAALMKATTAEARGVLVFCHPLLKSGYHYFLRGGLAGWGAGEGFHGVLFNFKGIGRSSLGGLCFADDVVGAVAFARDRFPGLPVHLVGHSFGGYHAAHALARLDGDVASAVFDSVPPRITNFFRSGPSAFLMKGLSRSPWAGVTGISPISPSLARIHLTPLLLIYGDEDEYCPAEEVHALATAVPTASLRKLPGTGHLQGFREHRDAYTSALLEHWKA
jgi:pimeloyl-ACP methyl ester carboxylesterase